MEIYSVTIFLFFTYILSVSSKIPVVITTWNFPDATLKAWDILQNDGVALDAVEQGATVCEQLQCDGTVGYGGSPDEDGESTLEAMIMDGRTLNVGSVAAMRRIKQAISVARRVLDHTSHSILAGDSATKFAVKMGFQEENLSSNISLQLWQDWKKNYCQPNFWMNVYPDSRKTCGPYKPFLSSDLNEYSVRLIDSYNHDTIGILAIDSNGDIAAGTSTNGAKYKIPGRVGDSPIPGAGAYADNEAGAAAATGDGDIMLRVLPSFLAVEEMRRGKTPSIAAKIAIGRIAKRYPKFSGGVIAVNKDGDFGAGCHGINIFPFLVHNATDIFLHQIPCSNE